MNKVQLIGWLGNDPEIITIKDGRLLARLRLATDVFISQADGTAKKYTSWHTVKLWDQAQIELFRNYLTKGSHVLVEGRIEYRQYRDKLGVTRKVTEIMAIHLVDLDR